MTLRGEPAPRKNERLGGYALRGLAIVASREWCGLGPATVFDAVEELEGLPLGLARNCIAAAKEQLLIRSFVVTKKKTLRGGRPRARYELTEEGREQAVRLFGPRARAEAAE